jgi:hypothetical protein
MPIKILKAFVNANKFGNFCQHPTRRADRDEPQGSRITLTGDDPERYRRILVMA